MPVAVGRHEVERLEKRRGVGLDRRGVPEAHAVHEHCCGVRSQSSDAQLRRLARPAAVANLHAGGEAHDLAERARVPGLDFLTVDDADRFRRLLRDLRHAGGGHDHGVVDAGHLEIDVQGRAGPGGDRHDIGTTPEAGLGDFDHEHARGQIADAVLAGGAGRHAPANAGILARDANLGAGNRGALHVADATGQRRALAERRRREADTEYKYEEHHTTSHR